ncbi:MAG: DUF3467 domain-containing protein [Patescibacteria group bacterium]|nr:DUF3467 domain-containing protein [Patescibacteria group bacterium]
MNQNQAQGQKVNLKATDEILKGHYANNLMAAHSKEEFVLDFINLFPPQGQLVSRIVTSPGHLKRIVNALTQNLKKYEEKFGEIKQAENPQKQDIGFKG